MALKVRTKNNKVFQNFAYPMVSFSRENNSKYGRWVWVGVLQMICAAEFCTKKSHYIKKEHYKNHYGKWLMHEQELCSLPKELDKVY